MRFRAITVASYIAIFNGKGFSVRRLLVVYVARCVHQMAAVTVIN